MVSPLCCDHTTTNESRFMMKPSDYEFLADFLLKSSGLNLGTDKSYLLESRLMPIANSLGMQGIEDLVCSLKVAGNQEIKTSVIEAMTTNETLFFRDKKPFDDLVQRMLPEIMEQRRHQRKIRIWCAACSTGQEPYSILMAIREQMPAFANDWKLELVATDLSDQVLVKARAGVYSQFEVQRGLSIQMLMKYFNKVNEGWEIKQELRSLVSWKQLNLLEHFRHLGQFDIIFCRNVLIYFDTATKKSILDRMAQQLEPHGYLVLGGAETVLGITNTFKRAEGCLASVYNSYLHRPELQNIK